ncbi:hypothetical protein T440DRAFT_467707 [Plenodomus tracheiphilus IPT5]|uniref:Uncharacterized protein n=1 Tax=Plenodomus tracheiphilus IPT5 TaxID=1408161 RepID=A0A6A7B7P8_9PLEO|nr:hypothetical protein T440DRAFT_467707 [Plenodomus tracheiphilus IPT5]
MGFGCPQGRGLRLHAAHGPSLNPHPPRMARSIFSESAATSTIVNDKRPNCTTDNPPSGQLNPPASPQQTP